MKRILTLILLSFFFQNLKAQSPLPCGTPPPANIHELIPIFRLAQAQTKTNEMLYLPVKAHIIRRSNGTGGLSTNSLIEQIEIMNTYFINSEIQFFLCGGINFIDDDNFYNFNHHDEFQMGLQYDAQNMINIYFANTVSINTDRVCGYAYYPGGPDRILMDNSCALNGTTLSHEMGHFFSLMHTHGSPSTANELVNGSNCSSAGDLICDTPADPQLSNSNVNTSCNYTDHVKKDANGDVYKPDVRNIMSYSRKDCRNLFSQEQYNVMRYTSRNIRDYFTCTDNISLNPFTEKSFCTGNSFDFEFTVSSVFDTTNIFSLELSNKHGVFDAGNPNVIGTLKGKSHGTITANFPSTIEYGNSYRLRITSSNPLSISNVSDNALSIFLGPILDAEDKLTVCEKEFNLTTSFTDLANTVGTILYWEDGELSTPLLSPELISSNGTYYIQKVTDEGCESLKNIELEFIEPPVKPEVSIEDKTLSSNYSEGNQWYNRSGHIQGATAQIFLPEANNTYYVVVTENGCVSEPSDPFTYTLAGNNPPPVSVYPNPAKEVLYLSFNKNFHELSIAIDDLHGREIFFSKVEGANIGNSHKIWISDLPVGVYILKVVDEGEPYIMKFLKTN